MEIDPQVKNHICLTHRLNKILVEYNLKIVTAESCTGGLLASLLTSYPGSSNWFDRGFVTYSNDAKTEELGVKKELIATYSAVSHEVAIAMAEGALKASHAHISIAITGIAGPDSDNNNTPVGYVCFAISMINRQNHSYTKQLPAFSRHSIRMLACTEALTGIITYLEQH